MSKEFQQAESFCKDYFGTSDVTFDGVPFVEALEGYLKLVKHGELIDCVMSEAPMTERRLIERAKALILREEPQLTLFPHN